MEKAVIVNPDGKWEIVEFAKGDSLKMMQKAVDGLIEPIDVKPGLTMWVNEEYLFRADFEHNILASAVYEEASGVAEHQVFGSVVFTGGTDSAGYTLGLGEKALSVVQATAEFHEMTVKKTFG
jgi:hypothetical protein